MAGRGPHRGPGPPRHAECAASAEKAGDHNGRQSQGPSNILGGPDLWLEVIGAGYRNNGWSLPLRPGSLRVESALAISLSGDRTCADVNELCRGKQPSLDDQRLGDRLEDRALDLEGSAVGVTAHRATAAASYLSSQPVLHGPASDPDAVGLKWVGGEGAFFDISELKLRIDPQGPQYLLKSFGGPTDLDFGGPTSGARSTDFDQSLPTNG